MGTVHTKVVNGESKRGVHIYTDIHRWFTETWGLGLATQAGKLMDPKPVKKEEELTEKIKAWIQKVDRLAKYGSQYELPAVYRSVAPQEMLVGEPKRMFKNWRLEGMPFEKILTK